MKRTWLVFGLAGLVGCSSTTALPDGGGITDGSGTVGDGGPVGDGGGPGGDGFVGDGFMYPDIGPIPDGFLTDGGMPVGDTGPAGDGPRRDGGVRRDGAIRRDGGRDGAPRRDGGTARTCERIRTDYAYALALAQACSPMAPGKQCTVDIERWVGCGCMTTVNPAHAAAVAKLNSLKVEWATLKCKLQCPMLPCVAPRHQCSQAGRCS
ncbi:MAG: hypothetical protein IT371_19830 [Deltaproteobacteria bacterium]|nr:hypothetical protein [Deltaproteobacteria bacterium]